MTGGEWLSGHARFASIKAGAGEGCNSVRRTDCELPEIRSSAIRRL